MSKEANQFDQLISNPGYEQIIPQKSSAEGVAFTKYVEAATLWKIIGSVEGLSTLDLGCGNGGNTRLLLERGATSATGVDSSEKMLEKCETKESENACGVKFVLSDVASYKHPEPVDFVLINKVLHFSKDKDALRATASAVYNNLKQGGRLVGIVSVLETDGRPLGHPLDTIGFNFPDVRPLPDGVAVPVEIKAVGFTVATWWYYDATVAEIFKDVGFTNVEWHPLEIVGDDQFEARAKFEAALPDCSLRVLSAVKA